MCEKPIGLNAHEAQVLSQLGQQSDVVTMTAFTYRYAFLIRVTLFC